LPTTLSTAEAGRAQPKDEEADKFIAQAVAAQPSAPYFMPQFLLMQDQA
jgi:hypothetical protein